MKLFQSFGRVALILAVFLAATPFARAQEASAEETVLYQTWFGANSQGMQDKALEAAQAYLEKFPKGQYAAYLKNWLLGPKLQAFNAALQAKNTDEMIKVGRDILKQDPENLSIHYGIAFNLRRLELAASPANFAHAKEAIEFSNSALKLIEAGKVIEGGKFNKEASTAILYQIQALVAVDAKKTEEGIALYTKSSASDPGNVGVVAYNLLALASLHKAPYDAAVGVYRAFPEADRQAATSPEVKAALDAVYAKADPLIDAWARFVALTRARNVAAETREQVLGSLKTVYSTRYAGDATGLEPLLTKLQAEYAPKP
jgi:tetratricopeptide (TPR) repeat protein